MIKFYFNKIKYKIHILTIITLPQSICEDSNISKRPMIWWWASLLSSCKLFLNTLLDWNKKNSNLTMFLRKLKGLETILIWYYIYLDQFYDTTTILYNILQPIYSLLTYSLRYLHFKIIRTLIFLFIFKILRN